MKYKVKFLCVRFFITICLTLIVVTGMHLTPIYKANAMPFYNLQPKEIVLRSSFFTSYYSSSPERKHNIILASKAINNYLLDVGQEFSFNRTVGERSEKRGYKQAKIIVGGEFVDGIGGGVCQVSTTLYNAVLLAGLEITEYHPHSLSVNYVAPSFDAMVNSGWADLRFVNNTLNPIYIKSTADENRIKVEIYGEKTNQKLIRKSVITEEIFPEEPIVKIDKDGLYPELAVGEQKIVRYAKNGLRSEGYLIKMVDGRIVSTITIRKDKYSPVRELIMQGKDSNLTENSEIPRIE